MKETVIIPESNKIGDKVIDRIYQNLHKTLELVNKMEQHIQVKL